MALSNQELKILCAHRLSGCDLRFDWQYTPAVATLAPGSLTVNLRKLAALQKGKGGSFRLHWALGFLWWQLHLPNLAPGDYPQWIAVEYARLDRDQKRSLYLPLGPGDLPKDFHPGDLYCLRMGLELAMKAEKEGFPGWEEASRRLTLMCRLPELRWQKGIARSSFHYLARQGISCPADAPWADQALLRQLAFAQELPDRRPGAQALDDYLTLAGELMALPRCRKDPMLEDLRQMTQKYIDRLLLLAEL